LQLYFLATPFPVFFLKLYFLPAPHPVSLFFFRNFSSPLSPTDLLTYKLKMCCSHLHPPIHPPIYLSTYLPFHLPTYQHFK
jgi:hypothetical protein